MRKGKVSRFVSSVTNCWSYFADRLFHLKDDILSAEAVKCPAFTSDEFRVQHKRISDYWNEIAPKHCVRLKMEGDWPRAIPVASAMG